MIEATVLSKNITVFSDMDGCIAKWNVNASLEDTYEPDYFRKRELDANYAQILKNLMDAGIQVVFLSAVYGDEQVAAKIDWLRANGFENDAIFVPYGCCKREFIQKNLPEYVSDVNILIDDFTQNLTRWEKYPEFIGVKYLNGINDSRRSWEGVRIQSPSSAASIILDRIIEQIEKIA